MEIPNIVLTFPRVTGPCREKVGGWEWKVESHKSKWDKELQEMARTEGWLGAMEKWGADGAVEGRRGRAREG